MKYLLYFLVLFRAPNVVGFFSWLIFNATVLKVSKRDFLPKSSSYRIFSGTVMGLGCGVADVVLSRCLHDGVPTGVPTITAAWVWFTMTKYAKLEAIIAILTIFVVWFVFVFYVYSHSRS